MNTDQINKAFENLVVERNVYKKLGVSSGVVRTMRYNLKNGIAISIDKKMDWLKKAGLLNQEKTYVRKDLVSLLNFYKTTSQAARDHGPEYVIDKWEKTK
ncbi:MAG TPA: hypothetical protein VEB42_14615 [Chitinophagaceae bacterium]|nr:hypothetical protein [Chitinophagaceae bacterium]